jgi:hypothetical protein
MTSREETDIEQPPGTGRLDGHLRRDCLRLFEACLAQIRSGLPGPSLLISREFEATLESLCERLRGEGQGEAPALSEKGLLIHLIVAASVENARDSLRKLRQWLKGSEDVILCDPYLLQFNASAMFPNVDSYAEAIAELFSKSVKKIDLYTNSYNQKVRPAVLGRLKEGRNIRHFSSDRLHDRFLLKGQSEGKVLGTSLGGFGRKFFAVVDLDSSDVVEVVTQLRTLYPRPLFHRR